MNALTCTWIHDNACIWFYGSDCKNYISSVCITRSAWFVITRLFDFLLFYILLTTHASLNATICNHMQPYRMMYSTRTYFISIRLVLSALGHSRERINFETQRFNENTKPGYFQKYCNMNNILRCQAKTEWKEYRPIRSSFGFTDQLHKMFTVKPCKQEHMKIRTYIPFSWRSTPKDKNQNRLIFFHVLIRWYKYKLKTIKCQKI